MIAVDFETENGVLGGVIFAVNEDRAASQFCDLHLARFGRMPGVFAGRRRTIRREDNKNALRAALRKGVEGLGEFDGREWMITRIPVMPPPECTDG